MAASPPKEPNTPKGWHPDPEAMELELCTRAHALLKRMENMGEPAGFIDQESRAYRKRRGRHKIRKMRFHDEEK